MGNRRKIKRSEEKIHTNIRVINTCLWKMSLNAIHIKTLQNEIAKLEQPFLHAVRKLDYNSDKIWLNKRIDELESKLSFKWYTNEGIYKRIRTEIADQISQNMNDIAKLKEALQDE